MIVTKGISEKTHEELSQFLMDNPTLTHQRRALGANGKLATAETVDNWIGEKLSLAGSVLLEQIHNELFESLPSDKKVETELEKEPFTRDENGKPELTPEYLRYIGRPDILEWGTD